jgi:hypothetical protein
VSNKKSAIFTGLTRGWKCSSGAPGSRFNRPSGAGRPDYGQLIHHAVSALLLNRAQVCHVFLQIVVETSADLHAPAADFINNGTVSFHERSPKIEAGAA